MGDGTGVGLVAAATAGLRAAVFGFVTVFLKATGDGVVTTLALPMLEGPQVQTIGALGGMAAALVDREVNRQALMIAYLDDFHAMMLLTLAALPLVLLLRKPKQGAAGGPPFAAFRSRGTVKPVTWQRLFKDALGGRRAEGDGEADLQQFAYRLCAGAVEVAGGLVGQKERRLQD